MRRLGWLTLFIGLSACSFAPPYHVPDSVATPPQYQGIEDWQRTEPKASIEHDDWWTVFGDSTLDRLESQAVGANQTLQAAFARLQEARADTRVARADLFPNLSATASVQRARVSTNSPTYLTSTQAGPIEGNDFMLQGDLSWEIDLWGRIRNQVRAARATQQAQADDLAVLRLSIGAEIADDYFGLRAFDAQVDVLMQTVRDYTQSLALVQAEFDGGVVALPDLAQATSQLRTAQTEEADAHLMREQMEHALAVLVGENASSFHIDPHPLPMDTSPPLVDPGLPSSLLERRPDVAEAERRVAAANAQIGVARAAYFPQFSLMGSGGFNSVSAATFIEAPSLFWSVGPQVTAPIFEGGRLVAQTERAKASYNEQVANYRSTVLTAFREVEDNLIALRRLERESETQAGAVAASRLALQKAQERYQEGLTTFLEVSTTETTALQAQLSQVNIQNRRLMASVLLIKALGGGWQPARQSYN